AGPAATLPLDGTYQAELTAADLLAAGAYSGADTFLAGTATLTFDKGSFSLGAGQLDTANCGGWYSVAGSVVRLFFAAHDGCEGMDDVRVVPSDDGTTMTMTFVVC